MSNKDFTIIFEKLSENTRLVAKSTEGDASTIMLSEGYIAELDELAELRRMAAEIAEPEPTSFTTT